MSEVVKKEVLKLLDTRIIYPISDNKWISLVHVIPKKGGIKVVKNKKIRFFSHTYSNRVENVH